MCGKLRCVDSTSVNHVSLCSGYGGIDLGLRRVIGERLRTIAYAEIEAAAIEVLLARMEGGQLDAAPVWSDIKKFPLGDFHMVDILSGGYPCQPFSVVGKRLGPFVGGRPGQGARRSRSRVVVPDGVLQRRFLCARTRARAHTHTHTHTHITHAREGHARWLGDACPAASVGCPVSAE